MEKSEVRVNLLFFHVSFPFLRSSFSKGQAKSRTNHKDKIKNNLNNPETNPRTPTLRTNPQITKMVLVWVETWERWARDWTTVYGGEDGWRKSQGARPRKFREHRSGFVVFYWSGFVVSFFFVDLPPSLWSLLFLLSEFVELES